VLYVYNFQSISNRLMLSFIHESKRRTEKLRKSYPGVDVTYSQVISYLILVYSQKVCWYILLITLKHFPFIPFFIIFVHSPLLLTLSNALLKSTNVQHSFFLCKTIDNLFDEYLNILMKTFLLLMLTIHYYSRKHMKECKIY
jgi:hypothetical protein